MTNAIAPLYPLSYEPVIRRALEEDIGVAGDVTTDSIAQPGQQARGVIAAREEGRVAGLDVALHVFRMLDPGVGIEVVNGDGSDVNAGDRLAIVTGSARVLLTGERTALNLLGRMCGIATTTRDLVRKVGNHKARIVCTRKTAPGLRVLDKYSVRAGGGSNHRFGLDDGVLIKDNHRLIAGGVRPAVEAVRNRLGHMVKLEVEVDTLDELRELLELDADAVLLDNMPPDVLRKAVELIDGRLVAEASGGITPDTVADVAASGVDLISLGWLTHSVTNMDVAFDFEPV